MNVMTNGRALAIAVGDSLFLPSGREVPLSEAGGWADSEAGPEEALPQCRSAAEAAQAREDALEAGRRSAAAEARRNEHGRAVAGERSSRRRACIAGYAGRGARGGADRASTTRDFEAEARDLLSRVEELPERAEDFASGVAETLSGMLDTYKRIRHATPRMFDALDGIEAGVSGWED